MNKSINTENQIVQVEEVNPNFHEVPNLPDIPSGVGIGNMTCFVLALTVFYKTLNN